MATTINPFQSTLSPRAKFAAARLWACEKAPYFRAAIMSLIVKESDGSDGLTTMAVSEHGLLYVNFEALKGWSIEQWGTGVLHEVGHYLRDHAGRRRGCSAEPHEWNVACDAELNDDFLGDPFKPGADWIYPKTIKAPNGLTAEAYLAFVRKQAQNQPQNGKGQQQGAGGSSAEGEGEGEGKGGDGGQASGSGAGSSVGQGRCGSAAGFKSPCEKADDKGEGRSEAHGNQVRRQVAEAIQNAASKASNGRGSVPAGWARWADEFTAPAKIDWREKMGDVIRGQYAYVCGCVDYTYQRPSRRQAGLGWGSRSPVLPALRQPVPKVAIVIDASGSMGQEQLNDAARESNGILQALGAEVIYCTNDAVVHEIQKVRTIEEALALLKGGGGTDFRPPFRVLADWSEGPPDLVIFITDGMGPAPIEEPEFCRTIWVLVGPMRTIPNAGDNQAKITWGEFVEVDDDEDEPATKRKR